MANRLVGNSDDAAALECTVIGPTLRFDTPAWIAITGADMLPKVNGTPVPLWHSIEVKPGDMLQLGAAQSGTRSYIAVSGGINVPVYLNSKSTFLLGKFGGHAGRAIRTGDVLRIGSVQAQPAAYTAAPAIANEWEIGVLYGPHGAPRLLDTDDDIDTFFATEWRVHHNSDRTGVRLIGPQPRWARPMAVRPGFIPSNIHDNAYAVGTGRLHRRHADHARSRRSQPGRVRVPGHRRARPPLEAGPAPRRGTASALRRVSAAQAEALERPRTRCPRDAGPGRRVDAGAASAPERRGRRRYWTRSRRAAHGRASCSAAPATTICWSNWGRRSSISRCASGPRPHVGARVASCPRSSTSRRGSARFRSTTDPRRLPEEAPRPCARSRSAAAGGRPRCRAASSTSRCRGEDAATLGHREVHARSCAPDAPGCPATSSSSDASTAWPASTRCAGRSMTPRTWCSVWATSISARRWPRPSIRAIAW